MRLPTEAHADQVRHWPATGRHILAHYDEASIIVYQAYRQEVARFALAAGHFGGPAFSFNRMSWIKPNFLWMMYRSGWATKPGQEMVLGLRVGRGFFDGILATAVPAQFDASLFADHALWQAALAASDVRLQWDPDHAPSGAALPRRAIQLGLRGATLRGFTGQELREVIDMTPFVAAQRPAAVAGDMARLPIPRERVYRPPAAAAKRIGLDTGGTDGEGWGTP